MNKRYLYRAKAIDTGDLVFGSLVYSPKEDEYYIVEHNGEELSWLVDEKTISQCTRYEDDNENLMFEGDEVVVEAYGEKYNYIIVWSESGFKLQNKENICIYNLSQVVATFYIKLINPTYTK